MKYSFKELVDVTKLQALTDELYRAAAIPSAIITMDGEVLTGSGWQRICTDFHRQHPQIEKECIESDTEIRKKLDEGEPFAIYKCPRGLVDASSPVIIAGEHVANVFAGQVFLDPPDETTEQFFREQARKFGFDEIEYIKAFREIPIFPKERFRAALSFLSKLAKMIASMGLIRLRELEAMEALRQSEEKYRSIFENAVEGLFQSTPEGRFISVNPAFARMLGYASPEEIVSSISDIATQYYRDSGDRRRYQKLLQKNGTVENFEFKVKCKDGSYIWVSNSTRAIYDRDGKIVLYEGNVSDINDRKQAEENLLKQRYLLKKAQEIGKIGTWELDIRKNELLWTDENYRIFGIPIGTPLTYETFLNCVHPDDREYVDTEWRASFSGKPYEIEHRLLVDGKVQWVMEKAELEFNEKDECIRGIGFTQDITDRRLAEVELWESTERFKKVFNSQLDMIFVLNADMPAIILECNQAAIDSFGYSSDELIGGAVNKLHVDDSHMKTFQKQLFSAISAKKRLKNYEFSMKRKDGTIFPSEHTVLEMKNDSGVRTGWISIIRDLSEIRRTQSALIDSEKKFRTLFDNSPISYQSLDGNGNFIEVNETWLTVLGYKKEEVIGRNFSEFLHPDWQAHFKTNFPRFKAVGEILGVEFEIAKKDGSFILVSFHGKIGHTPDGNFKQTHCMFRDITEQKRIEDEKIVLENRLQQSQKMESIGNLAGGIAHDFNNILFPIVGLSEILIDDLPSGSLEYHNAQEIFKAGKRGSDLVKQILAFSRQTEHEMIPVKVQRVLKEVLKLSRSTIPSNIEITRDIQNDCRLVLADATQVHQIAMNLITNAYHAVEQTGGKISVLLKETELASDDLADNFLEPGRYAMLSVSDTGCGIAPAVMDKIFEPYFTTKEQGKGTGLGLAVIYGIIKAHDGDIKVYSEVGKGTSFTVYLPLMEKSSETVPAGEVEKYETGTERILVVDDEEPIAKLEKQMLERLGYRVTFRTNSLEALEAFKANPDAFDLVVTDMAMPLMTGNQLAKELVLIKPGIPVIICTGFSEKLSDKKAKAIGIKGFLMKPIVRSDMASMVRKVLDEAKI